MPAPCHVPVRFIGASDASHAVGGGSYRQALHQDCRVVAARSDERYPMTAHRVDVTDEAAEADLRWLYAQGHDPHPEQAEHLRPLED